MWRLSRLSWELLNYTIDITIKRGTKSICILCLKFQNSSHGGKSEPNTDKLWINVPQLFIVCKIVLTCLEFSFCRINRKHWGGFFSLLAALSSPLTLTKQRTWWKRAQCFPAGAWGHVGTPASPPAWGSPTPRPPGTAVPSRSARLPAC